MGGANLSVAVAAQVIRAQGIDGDQYEIRPFLRPPNTTSNYDAEE
jgi:hypothetical protein